jgi:hypothetical protein
MIKYSLHTLYNFLSATSPLQTEEIKIIQQLIEQTLSHVPNLHDKEQVFSSFLPIATKHETVNIRSEILSAVNGLAV